MAKKRSTGGRGMHRSRLALPGPAIDGVIGETYAASNEDWRKVPKAPEGAPADVVIIRLDDVGFGQVSTFGGPVPIRELARLVTGGLRYNRFRTTDRDLRSVARGADRPEHPLP